MSTVSKKTIDVAGIIVNVYSHASLDEPGRDIAVLFLLHGRHGSVAEVEIIANRVLVYVQSQGSTDRDLVVVTFDHRNHGTRLVNRNANDDWKNDNKRHAVDMYAIQMGTALDVSFLIDFLPAYLFPSGEREVREWMLSGISLGGHSTWIVLKDEPRVKIGIPIIGCPDYLSLMGPRAQASGLTIAPPHFPPSIIDRIKTRDPASIDGSSLDPSLNPFLGKHILVLSGADDRLVPWSASKRFVDTLQVGNGTKKVVVQENTGHECTPRMLEELASFVWQHGMNRPVKSSI